MMDSMLRTRAVRAAYWRICRLGVALVARRTRVGAGTRFLGVPLIDIAEGSSLTFGQRCSIVSRGALTALNVNHPCTFRTLRAGASIVLGDDVGMSGGSICAASSVRIADRVLIGANVTIVDTDFHDVDAVPRRYAADEPVGRPVVIGPDVFLGAGVTVLKGVTIGAGTVVGAGSVVATDLPERVVAAGVPAKVVRVLRSGEGSGRA